ncbi:hypothetical protein ACTNEO_19970 [Gracilibacillus sp. HCP3S3_G5_1]|uniref:hypothetical protein n=1 Tax=unclassified Gracilibacillus TaxID=2625209 RepID=UPI003F8B7F49
MVIEISWLKDNLIEILLLIGMAFLSIGFFIWSIITGFIVTGLLFIGISIIAFYFYDENEGGD